MRHARVRALRLFLQQISDAQPWRPGAQIGEIEPRATHFQDATQIVPLALRSLAAGAIPEQLVKNGVLSAMATPASRVVVGSLASSAHGIPRTTLDIDLVADLRLEQVDNFAAALKTDFYADPEMIKGFRKDPKPRRCA